MSPGIKTDDGLPFGFPRVSGDEPQFIIFQGTGDGFSPRERG